jgi:probable rRNA maturation factor
MGFWVKEEQKKEPYMFLDNIEIVTKYKAAELMINQSALSKIIIELNLSKGVIYNIISDEELLQVNKQVLQHDYYTDIITFDYSDDEDIEQHEILISWDRIKENAAQFNQPLEQELHRVCIHGLLHIAGQNDITDEEKLKMRSLENHYLALHCST